VSFAVSKAAVWGLHFATHIVHFKTGRSRLSNWEQPSPPFLFPFPPLPFPLPPLRSRPFNTARGLGERCKLPQMGLPVCWQPCWIWGRDRRRATSAVPPVDASTRKSGCSRWNFDDICRSFGDTSTSGLLAAMLDLRERSTSGDVGSAPSGRVDPEKRV